MDKSVGEITVSISYTKEEAEFIDQLELALEQRMAKVNEKRYKHSLSVARYAEHMAKVYGSDPYKARVAGILHDWDKLLTKDELIDSLSYIDFDFGVDPNLILPLIHGVSAAYHLRAIYGDKLDESIYSAIAKHTVAGLEMSKLDMIIYIADAIEPTRPKNEKLDWLREQVGQLDLDELFFETLKGSIIYVLERGRYLWPKTLEVYNAWAK